MWENGDNINVAAAEELIDLDDWVKLDHSGKYALTKKGHKMIERRADYLERLNYIINQGIN